MSMLDAPDSSCVPAGNEQFRALSHNELEDCLDLWTEVFHRSDRDYFVPYFFGDPRFKCDYTLVCVTEGRIVSTVHICEREVRVGEILLRMGGIANVATHPEFRRKGYGTRLVRDAVEVMHTHDMDFSILFTGIHHFYEKVGYRSIPIPARSGKLRAGLCEPSHSKYSIRTCEWPYDINNLQLIYDDYNSRRPLTILRDADYWRGYALPRFGAPKSTLMAGTGGRITGYLFFESEGENCWLREIGCLAGDEECLDVLLRCAASRASDAGAKVIHSYLPAEPEVLRSFEKLVQNVEEYERKDMMCRVVSMQSLSRKVLPELNRRARLHRPPPGALSLQTDYGAFAFTVRFGHVSLGARKAENISLSQSDFFSLLFGIKEIDELNVRVSRRGRDILTSLFPPHPATYWTPDGF